MSEPLFERSGRTRWRWIPGYWDSDVHAPAEESMRRYTFAYNEARKVADDHGAEVQIIDDHGDSVDWDPPDDPLYGGQYRHTKWHIRVDAPADRAPESKED